MEIHPPTYPLSRDAFKSALVRGHGRALIHAGNFGVTDFKNEILEAATTCLVYDTQIDGYREWWLAGLCEAAGLIDTIINLPPEGSAQDRSQRAALLGEFARAGHQAALPKLYDMCCFDHPDHEIYGCDELIRTDGENGLIFVAKRLGERLIQDSDHWVGDWELDLFDELHGEGRGEAVLSEAARNEQDILAYLEEVRSYQTTTEEGKIARPETIEPVEDILELIQTSPKRESRLRGWGRRASHGDLSKVADFLTIGGSPITLINALVCLGRRGLPTFDADLLWLAFHEDDDVRFHATRLFAHHDEPQVRAAGLALIGSGDLLGGTAMLRLSARNEDAEAILAALGRSDPGEEDHGILSNLVQLLERNGSMREPLIPLHVYEHSPCMHCRERAIEILIKWEACPQWVLDEACRDASGNIRSLMGSREQLPPRIGG
ncbi:MAG: hypothetical protein EOP87_09210 [Verrucomicrobiaceae bacterium]|nr:MAG: hypothetical protein EOP87_09210 [Verrucomicrobiaceae bacterium]